MPPEFAMRSDAVDVGEIMKQIRARIRDKRGVDYTEEEIRQLASVKLETFLDPTRVRSDLVQQYRRAHDPAIVSTLEMPPENYAFEDHLVYGSARGVGGRMITGIRKLLNPVLKLFINPNPIVHVLNRQSAINAHNEKQFERIERVRTDLAALNYEVVHNLVVEMTRLAVEVKNLKMRVESLSGRLDFTDRRARALEAVVQYKPGTGPAAEEAAAPPAQPAGQSARREGGPAPGEPVKGEAQRSRRKRRRRGRGGAAAAGHPSPAGDGAAPAGGEPSGGTDVTPADHEPHGDAEGGSLPFDREAAPEPPARPEGPDPDDQ